MPSLRICPVSLIFALAAVLGILVLAGSAHAQALEPVDRPTPYVSQRLPTQRERDRVDSLKLYVLGLLCENEDRLLEALQAFQDAVKLDPDAAAVYKAQVPILITLDRRAEALAATGKVIELDPSDYETWYIRARLLKIDGKLPAARAALLKGLATVVFKAHPENAHQMYFELGSILEIEGSFKQAADAFLESARILEHPDHLLDFGIAEESIRARVAEVYERIGGLLVKVREFDQAIAAYKKAQTEVAGRLNINIAQIYVEQGKFQQALDAIEGFLSFQPQGIEAYQLKIEIMRRLGKNRELLPWLAETSQKDRHNVALKRLLAKEYAEANQSANAERIYLELAEREPDVSIYRGLFGLYKNRPNGTNDVLGLLNKTLKQAAEAKLDILGTNNAAAQARAMIAALRDDADLSKNMVSIALNRLDHNTLKFETVHFLAILADRHRQLAESEKFYRDCLARKSQQNEALIYNGLLRVLWRAHQYEAIAELCRTGLKEAVATKPFLFHRELARVLARLHRFDEAVKQADEGIKEAGDTELVRMKCLRISVLALKGDLQQAETESQTLLDGPISPSDVVDIRHLLSDIYTSSKQIAKAEEQLQWVLRFDPNHVGANNDLGYLWADQGKNLKEAEEMIRKALELDRQQRKRSVNILQEEDKDSAAYVDSLGWVLFRKGQVEEARKELERAISLPESEDPVIFDHLGDVYYRLKMVSQARDAWQKALQLFEQDHRPRDDRYRDVQRKLKIGSETK